MYIGIDLGTTGCKVVLFSPSGEILQEYNKEYEVGKVTNQDPAYRKNFTIKENTKIVLTISKGTEMTTVPKVVGMEYETAVKEIENAKLKILEYEKPLYQSHSEEATNQEGSAVTLS